MERSQHPTAWFWLGAFVSWNVSLYLAADARAEPSRWNSVVGLYVGIFASALIAGLMAGVFAAWLRWRQGPRKCPHFVVPLILGILLPWLLVACLLAYEYLADGPPPELFFAAIIFGSPVLLGELLVRLSATTDA